MEKIINIIKSIFAAVVFAVIFTSIMSSCTSGSSNDPISLPVSNTNSESSAQETVKKPYSGLAAWRFYFTEDMLNYCDAEIVYNDGLETSSVKVDPSQCKSETSTYGGDQLAMKTFTLPMTVSKFPSSVSVKVKVTLKSNAADMQIEKNVPVRVGCQYGASTSTFMNEEIDKVKSDVYLSVPTYPRNIEGLQEAVQVTLDYQKMDKGYKMSFGYDGKISVDINGTQD